MIRKAALAITLIAALTFASLGGFGGSSADAQTCAQYDTCIAYPDGGFGAGADVKPKPTPTPRPTVAPAVDADNVAATASSSGGNQIAFTGSESRVLGYAGAGLIAFGAISLIAARRQQD